MEQKSLPQRVILPVVVVLATMIVAGVIYLHLAWRLGSGSFLGPIVSTVSACLFFASVGLGALYVYPTSYFRGASVAERIAACLVAPVIWNLKEMETAKRSASKEPRKMVSNMGSPSRCDTWKDPPKQKLAPQDLKKV